MKVTSLLLSAAFISLCAMADAEPLKLGASLPNVSALTDQGTPLRLTEALESGYALVYFYPKADTPGCTAQGCSLRDAYQDLTAQGVRVVGVSVDSVEDQQAFKKKYQLPFTLLADTEKAVMSAFGVPPNPRGTASRQAFLFKDGKLVWRDLSASTQEQAADVLAAIRSSLEPGA